MMKAGTKLTARGLCRRVWLCLLTGCLLGVTARAQYRFDHWTADNGLPQNSVRDIVQTRDGYIWLTTFDGLVRFDGVRFTVFNKSNSPGIVTNRFYFLYQDAQGDLWAMTEDAGVTRLHAGRFTTYTTAQGLPDNNINAIGGDGQGRLVLFIGPRAWRWVEGKFLPADDWRAGKPAVEREQYQHAPCYPDKFHFSCFVDGRMRRLDGVGLLLGSHPPVQDEQGNVWFDSLTGLRQFRDGQLSRTVTTRDGLPSDHTIMVYGSRPLQVLAVGTDGGLWLTEVASRKSVRLVARTPDDFHVYGAYADREGNIWVWTYSKGLYRIRKQAVTAYGREQGLLTDEVYPIYEDRAGAIWVGSAGGGLFRYQDGGFTQYQRGISPWRKWVTSLYEDRAGQLRVSGYARFENGRLTRGVPEDILPETLRFCWTMYEDEQRALWLGLEGGVVRVQNGVKTHFTTQDGLAGNDTKVIIPDGQGGIWLGSLGGLTHYRDGKFRKWTEAEGLPGKTVRALRQDNDGTLWIGTYDSGLARFKDGRFTSYTTRDGLFDNGVFQILEDDFGWLWMSCNRGIYRVRKQELIDFAAGKIKILNSIAYGKSDGMLSVECNGGRWPAGIKARDGKLWFPTMAGVAVIDPATIAGNSQPPPVIIEEVRIDNRAVAPEDLQSAITITPQQANFEIQYTALSFLNSENLRFKYKLEGLDEEWIEAGTRRTVYFSHVAPGSYTFKVIAANSDGVWNTEGKSLRVTVLPPFYRAWWFLTLLACGVVGAVQAGHRLRVRRLHERQLAQENFTRQLIESQEAERKRIASELHDSLGQHLLIIKNRAILSQRLVSEQDPLKEQLDEINASATQAISEARTIAYNLRPINVERLGLTAVLEDMIEKVAAASDLQISADIESLEGFFSPEAEITLFRIVQESVNNIVKHAQATKAYVEIWREDGQLRATVRDNGRGFDPAANKGGGLGLTSIAERVRSLGGTHTIQTTPEQGTTLNFRVPL